jgi:hypothetical protein
MRSGSHRPRVPGKNNRLALLHLAQNLLDYRSVYATEFVRSQSSGAGQVKEEGCNGRQSYELVEEMAILPVVARWENKDTGS